MKCCLCFLFPVPGIEVTKTQTNHQLMMANRLNLKAKQFVYRPPLEGDWNNGPDIVAAAVRTSYCKHVRAAEVSQQAGGYHEEVACLRALQDSMADLFY